LHDQSPVYVEKLTQAGIAHSYREAQDMPHGFIHFAVVSEAAHQHWLKACIDFRAFWDQQMH
jgi:acetyl esterase/lipase